MAENVAIGKIYKRSLTVRGEAVNVENRTAELSFSSTQPVRRFFGNEILSHAEGAIDFTRLNDGASLLFNHDVNQLLGCVERCWVGDNKGRAIVRFSQDPEAERRFKQVQEGMLMKTSVSYQYLSEPVESGRDKNGVANYTAMRWQPLEISLVTVPAATDTGIGRSLNTDTAGEAEPELESTSTEAGASLQLTGSVQERSETAGEIVVRSITGANTAGISHARSLVSEGKVVKPSSWNPPSSASEDAYIKAHSIEEFGKWHMGQDSKATKGTKGEFGYIFTSDFKNVDRKGLAAIAQRAGQQGQSEIGKVADELIAKIDGKTEKSVDASITIVRQKANKVEQNEQDILKAENTRVKEIYAIASQYADRVPKMAELRDSAVVSQTSVAEFRGVILDAMPDNTVSNEAKIGLSTKEKRAYSFKNAIMCQVQNSGVKAEFEREISDTVVKKLGLEAPRGIMVPIFDLSGAYQRGMQQETTGAGAELVFTDPGEFIDYLRNQLIATKLGVRYIAGLVGDVKFPRLSTPAATTWVAESTAPTAASGILDSLTITPQTVGTYVDYSRKLMLQSTPSVEGIVRNDIVQNIARAIDSSVFNGLGHATYNQPVGVASNTSVPSLGGYGAINISGMMYLLGSVLNANVDPASFAFATTPTLYAALKARPAIGTTYPTFLVDANDKVGGFPLLFSNSISSGYMFAGAWNQYIVGQWGGLDLLVDPYSISNKGDIRVRAFMSVDGGLRHPGAFAYATSVA